MVEFKLAANSLAKSSTPEPVGSKPLWKHKGMHLPYYIQHIANDLREKRGMSESQAIATAIAAVKKWVHGGGKVDATTRAAASKAVAEWEATKAKAHVKASNSDSIEEFNNSDLTLIKLGVVMESSLEKIIRLSGIKMPEQILELASDPKKPYGDVTYADPGYQADKQKRYPIDTAEHAKAAWNYINKEKNASKYSPENLAKVKSKIKSAAKKFGIKIAEDAADTAEDKKDKGADESKENS